MHPTTNSECALCGSTAHLMNDKWPGYQQPHTFKIYHCTFCNTSFSLPKVPTGAMYESIYTHGAAVPGYNRYWEYMKKVKQSNRPLDHLAGAEDIYWGVKQAVATLTKEKKDVKILEVGSGLGYLTYALNKAGYPTMGLDISQTAVSQAQKTFGDFYVCANLFDYVKLHAAQFDIVIFTEVIEHVEQPFAFVECILQLLKPGGHAIITTPNKSLYPADITWQTENPPVHFWWFSEDSLRLIAKKTGAAISFISFTDFYKKNYTSIDLKKCRHSTPMAAVLGSNGELLFSVTKKPSLKNSFRAGLSKLPAVKKTATGIKKYFTKIKEASNPDIIVCGDRGKVICAIFEKPVK